MEVTAGVDLSNCSRYTEWPSLTIERLLKVLLESFKKDGADQCRVEIPNYTKITRREMVALLAEACRFDKNLVANSYESTQAMLWAVADPEAFEWIVDNNPGCPGTMRDPYYGQISDEEMSKHPEIFPAVRGKKEQPPKDNDLDELGPAVDIDIAGPNFLSEDDFIAHSKPSGVVEKEEQAPVNHDPARSGPHFRTTRDPGPSHWGRLVEPSNDYHAQPRVVKAPSLFEVFAEMHKQPTYLINETEKQKQSSLGHGSLMQSDVTTKPIIEKKEPSVENSTIGQAESKIDPFASLSAGLHSAMQSKSVSNENIEEGLPNLHTDTTMKTLPATDAQLQEMSFTYKPHNIIQPERTINQKVEKELSHLKAYITKHPVAENDGKGGSRNPVGTARSKEVLELLDMFKTGAPNKKHETAQSPTTSSWYDQLTPKSSTGDLKDSPLKTTVPSYTKPDPKGYTIHEGQTDREFLLKFLDEVAADARRPARDVEVKSETPRVHAQAAIKGGEMVANDQKKLYAELKGKALADLWGLLGGHGSGPSGGNGLGDWKTS